MRVVLGVEIEYSFAVADATSSTAHKRQSVFFIEKVLFEFIEKSFLCDNLCKDSEK
jgi:hypothetical protein